jgi:phosphonatase-like hydrolase
MIKAVVFDMAGTTVNEQSAVYRTIHEVIRNRGIEVAFETVLAHGAGKEKRLAFHDVLLASGMHPTDEFISECYSTFQYSLEATYKAAPVEAMPGAIELFKYLRNRGIAVVLNTGYPEHIARLLLDRLNWREGEAIDLLVSASNVAKARPHPDMINYAIDRLGLNGGHELAKVGDTVVDVLEGLNAKCWLVVGVTTGADSRERLSESGAHAVVDSLNECYALLEKKP